MNYSTWSLKRRARADLLKKSDWVLMKRPGSIRGARLRWEEPYLFKGYRDPETKRKTVLQDNKGQKWYRASNQVRKYYYRLDFKKLYMDRIKEIMIESRREKKSRCVLWRKLTTRPHLLL
jgi:hypothetical protein